MEEWHSLKKGLLTAKANQNMVQLKTILDTLGGMSVTKQLLKATSIGKVVNSLRKCDDTDVKTASIALVQQWRQMVRQQSQSSLNLSSDSITSSPLIERKPAASTKSAGKAVVEVSSGADAVAAPADPKRQRACTAFAKAISVSWEEGVKDDVAVDSAWNLGCQIEAALFAKWNGLSKDYLSQYRSVLTNLKDPKNPHFRRRICLGLIKPDIVPTLTPLDMASDDLKKERKAQEDWDREACTVEKGVGSIRTEMFKCGRCGGRDTSYFELQTRRADEPATLFITCLGCRNSWRG